MSRPSSNKKMRGTVSDTARASRLGIFLLLSLIYSSPLEEQMVVHRQLDTIPDGYIQAGRADPKQTINLSVGLASNNNTGLTQRLYDVSMPDSPNYGQYLTKEEVDEYLRPNVNTTKAFNQWMSRHGIKPSPTSSSGNHFAIELSVSKAEELLNTSFYYFNHTPSNQRLIRTKEYSVPSSLHEDILLLQPTTQFNPPPVVVTTEPEFPPLSPQILSRAVNNLHVNRCLKYRVNQYGIPSNIQTSEQIGILSFIGQSVQGVSLANLDSQMVVGLVPSARVKIITTGSQTSFPLDELDVFNFVLWQSDPPFVLSMSYGGDEVATDPDAFESVCEVIKALGTRGVTVIAGSGDGGVSGIGPESCTKFNLTYPSACAWVLSVGATNISSGTEIAAAFSSGGFSNVFPVEDFQANASKNYQEKIGNTYAGLYNPQGSIFPVSSMVGWDVPIHDQGVFGLTGGTSASAPVAAAVITALNQ
ncbi:hypothetical protein Clacol_005046, partial [Clathrus columnatus]